MSRLSPYLLTSVLMRGREVENLGVGRRRRREGRRRKREGGKRKGEGMKKRRRVRRGRRREREKEEGAKEEGRREREKEEGENEEEGRRKEREGGERKEEKESVHTHLMLSFITALMAYSRVICEDCGLCRTRSITSNTSSSVTCMGTCSGEHIQCSSIQW